MNAAGHGLRAAAAGRALLVATLVLASGAACALVVLADDAAESTTAPGDDPGWASVGAIGDLSGIHLGNGWMLTAAHVGIGPVRLGGHTFAPVPGSAVPLQNPDGSAADLILFRLERAPDLPALRIVATTPAAGTRIVMIGQGRDRGIPISWSGRAGFRWGKLPALRWGTNRVFRSRMRVTATESFATQFHETDGTPLEAQAAVGDSGGAAFVKVRGKWRLAGVLFAVVGYENQPPETSLYGNLTLIADLSRYRRQIETLMAAPTARPAATRE